MLPGRLRLQRGSTQGLQLGICCATCLQQVRSSDFLSPTWEGEQQGGAASGEQGLQGVDPGFNVHVVPGLARGWCPLLHGASLESELRRADLTIKSVLAGDLCG